MESESDAQPLMELVAALEHATLMAKQLPSTIDPSQMFQVCSSFQNAHHHLGAFLSRFHSSQPLLASDKSFASTVGEDEPMQVGDDEEVEIDAEAEGKVEVEENSMSIVNEVEERTRDLILQNKRRKRHLSPSPVVAADQRPSYDNGSVREQLPFDPREAHLSSLDLVFQFHG